MNFTRFSVAQLKEALRQLELKVSGNKVELIRRLQEVDEDMVAPVLAAIEDEAGVDTEEEAGMDDVESRGQLEVQVRELQCVVEALAAQLKALRPLASRSPQQDMSVQATYASNAHLSTNTLQPPFSNFHAVATSASQEVLQPRTSVTVSQNSPSQPRHQPSQQSNMLTDVRATTQQVPHAPFPNFASSQYATPQTHVYTTQLNTPRREGHSHTLQEIASILPSYDPCDNEYTSVQFVQRVEQLKETYNWDDSLLIFAVLGKLKGVAKRWADAQPVFREWGEFVRVFLVDFPYVYNATDAYIRVINSRIGKDEKIIEYYYRMLAVGRREKIGDVSINRYIINGLFDENVKRTLSAMNSEECMELCKKAKEV